MNLVHFNGVDVYLLKLTEVLLKSNWKLEKYEF
jgi:hypothetical protein